MCHQYDQSLLEEVFQMHLLFPLEYLENYLYIYGVFYKRLFIFSLFDQIYYVLLNKENC
jgi:hypothetical protein